MNFVIQVFNRAPNRLETEVSDWPEAKRLRYRSNQPVSWVDETFLSAEKCPFHVAAGNLLS